MSPCYLISNAQYSFLDGMGWQEVVTILFAKVGIYLNYLRCYLLFFHETVVTDEAMDLLTCIAFSYKEIDMFSIIK